jgi:hypothetical protein
VSEVHWPHFFVIQIHHWKVCQQSAVSELMVCKINLPPESFVMDDIRAPAVMPNLCFKGDRERSSELDGFVNWQFWSCFVVEKPENFVCQIDASASKLNLS